MEFDYPFAHKKLMTPGPVPLSQEVKESLYHLECHHRSKPFQEVLIRCFDNMKKVFQTKNHCYLLPSTGSGGLEAAMINVLKEDQSTLFINAGKFGERWGKIAKVFGLPFDEIVVPWGEDIPLEKVRKKLSEKKYQALAFQACETSTGALLPVKELCQLAHDQGALTIVDGITALGAVDLPMDKLGIDVFIGGSQKAFMLPTGMAFLSLSEKAESIQNKIPKYYFDLKAEKKSNLEGKTRFSTPTHFILGLDLVLDDFLNKTGLENHFNEILEKADVFRKALPLELFPQTSSPSLSCLKVPGGVSAKAIKDKVFDEGYIIVAGQDQLADKVLRVGHMGGMTHNDLVNTAEAINKFL